MNKHCVSLSCAFNRRITYLCASMRLLGFALYTLHYIILAGVCCTNNIIRYQNVFNTRARYTHPTYPSMRILNNIYCGNHLYNNIQGTVWILIASQIIQLQVHTTITNGYHSYKKINNTTNYNHFDLEILYKCYKNYSVI